MRHLLVDAGLYSLELEVADDADLDGQFEALCLDTGERLRVNGWMIENVEEVEREGK